MEKLERYIYENGIIYELGEHDCYYPAVYIDGYLDDINGNYAKARFEYLLECGLELLVELAAEDKIIEYFTHYQQRMCEEEKQIIAQSTIQDKMAEFIAQEILMYQDMN